MALTWRNVNMPSTAAAASVANAAFANQQRGLNNLRNVGNQYIAGRKADQAQTRLDNSNRFSADYLNASNDAERAAVANNVSGFGGQLNLLDIAKSRANSVDRSNAANLGAERLLQARTNNSIAEGELSNQPAAFQQASDLNEARLLSANASTNNANLRTQELRRGMNEAASYRNSLDNARQAMQPFITQEGDNTNYNEAAFKKFMLDPNNSIDPKAGAQVSQEYLNQSGIQGQRDQGNVLSKEGRKLADYMARDANKAKQKAKYRKKGKGGFDKDRLELATGDIRDSAGVVGDGVGKNQATNILTNALNIPGINKNAVYNLFDQSINRKLDFSSNTLDTLNEKDFLKKLDILRPKRTAK